jgi:hypothetical protein
MYLAAASLKWKVSLSVLFKEDSNCRVIVFNPNIFYPWGFNNSLAIYYSLKIDFGEFVELLRSVINTAKPNSAVVTP